MFLKNYFNAHQFIIIVAFVSFFFLETLSIFTVLYTKKSDINNYLSIASPSFKTHLDIVNAHLSNMANIFYDTTINKPAIIEIMSKASQTQNKHQLSQLRNRLLEELTPTYAYMKKHFVRQLHFQLPKSISFLRFHKPNKYGDDLTDIRKTIEYVNAYQCPISAFEEGRILNGFRNVYPLYKNNIFVGTVEISFAFDGLQNMLSTIDQTSYLFMIKKKVVNAKVFHEEQSNYANSEFSAYYYDKETLKDTMEFSLKKLAKINSKIANKVKKKIELGELFSIYYKNKDTYFGKSILISFIPISNLNNEVVAYVIHYQFGNLIDMILKKIRLEFLVLSFISLLLTLIVSILMFYQKKKQDAIHSFAVHDNLTGIYNRHGVNEVLNQKLEESKRTKKEFSIIFFDIDFFKKVNDTYGHDIGDFVLQNIANIVTAQIRASDIFARWGGEEFILFLPDTNLKDAVDVAQKLRQKIEEHAFGTVEKITCSFGVTTLKHEESKESFIKRVDILLYEAKESGRNCVVSDVQS
jgi:diguanylate cyclase (GGDEF)-like protein